MKLIIEINGGNLVACYSDSDNLEVTLVDWDNINDGDTAGIFQVDPISQLHPETAMLIESGYNR